MQCVGELNTEKKRTGRKGINLQIMPTLLMRVEDVKNGRKMVVQPFSHFVLLLA